MRDVSEDDVEVPLVIIGASPEDEEEGGSPVCLAHLVCEECGAVTTEGHRDRCSLAGTMSGVSASPLSRHGSGAGEGR